ncbi:putative WRKY transcription factor 40 [Senna tora]|uniref:Putative WRKY transcription factor 40 n=1 Tax=Senna tora TaxID=362788 RepID=A0A834XH50_9FABA|nr:putative WRKY transcription factor 40 [Senna tora]
MRIEGDFEGTEIRTSSKLEAQDMASDSELMDLSIPSNLNPQIKEQENVLECSINTTTPTKYARDGYQWKKYGQRVTRDNPSPRAYFSHTCVVAAFPIAYIYNAISRSGVLPLCLGLPSFRVRCRSVFVSRNVESFVYVDRGSGLRDDCYGDFGFLVHHNGQKGGTSHHYCVE